MIETKAAGPTQTGRGEKEAGKGIKRWSGSILCGTWLRWRRRGEGKVAQVKERGNTLLDAVQPLLTPAYAIDIPRSIEACETLEVLSCDVPCPLPSPPPALAPDPVVSAWYGQNNG